MSDAPPSLLSPASIVDMLELANSAPSGCFVEVGVYQGGSAWHLAELARAQGHDLHLFDTFTGIPYRDVEDNEHNIGDFANTSFEIIKQAIPDAVIWKGIFPDTMAVDWPWPIAFAHIDCDQYRGVKASIERLWPFMIYGGVMLFDDYGQTSGCTKAVNEGFEVSMIRRTSQGKAYVVKDTSNV